MSAGSSSSSNSSSTTTVAEQMRVALLRAVLDRDIEACVRLVGAGAPRVPGAVMRLVLALNDAALTRALTAAVPQLFLPVDNVSGCVSEHVELPLKIRPDTESAVLAAIFDVQSKASQLCEAEKKAHNKKERAEKEEAKKSGREAVRQHGRRASRDFEAYRPVMYPMSPETKRVYLTAAIERQSLVMLTHISRVLSATSFNDVSKAISHVTIETLQTRLATSESWAFFEPVIEHLAPKTLQRLLNAQCSIGLARRLVERGVRPQYLFPFFSVKDKYKESVPAFIEMFLDAGIDVSDDDKKRGQPFVPDIACFIDMPTRTQRQVLRFFNSETYDSTVCAEDAIRPHDNDYDFVRFLATRYRRSQAFDWLKKHYGFNHHHHRDYRTNPFFLCGPEPICGRHVSYVVRIPEARSLGVWAMTPEDVHKVKDGLAGIGYQVSWATTYYVPTTERPRTSGYSAYTIANICVEALLDFLDRDPDAGGRINLSLSTIGMCTPNVAYQFLESCTSQQVFHLFLALSMVEPYCETARLAASILRERSVVIASMAVTDFPRTHFLMPEGLERRVLRRELGLEEPYLIAQRYGLTVAKVREPVLEHELATAVDAFRRAGVYDDLIGLVLEHLSIDSSKRILRSRSSSDARRAAGVPSEAGARSGYTKRSLEDDSEESDGLDDSAETRSSVGGKRPRHF